MAMNWLLVPLLLPAAWAAPHSEPPKVTAQAEARPVYVIREEPLVLEFGPGDWRERVFDVVVKPRTAVRLAVKSERSSGFRVRMMMDRTGRQGPGMKNLLEHLKPEATYRNTGTEPVEVHFQILWSGPTAASAYRLEASLVP